MKLLGWEKRDGKKTFTVTMTKAEIKVMLKALQSTNVTDRQEAVAVGMYDAIVDALNS